MRAAGLLLGVSLIAVLWIVAFGLPDRLCDELTHRVCEGSPFTIDAGAARLEGWDELVFARAKAYRRRVAGPAAAEAAEVRVKLDPRAMARGEFCLRGIEVRDGVLRPFSLLAESPETAGSEPTDLRFSVPLSVRDCLVQGVGVASLDCIVAGTGPVLSFEKIVASVTNAGFAGVADGWVRYDIDAGVVTGRVATTFEPLLLEPLFAEWGLQELVVFLRRFKVAPAPPAVDTAFRVVTGTNYALSLDSQVRIVDGAYNGVPFMRADGNVHVRHGTNLLAVGVDPLVVVRRDGLVEGRVLVDTVAGTIAYDGASSIQPRELARAIGIFVNDELKPFTFGGAMRIVSGGVVNYSNDLAGSELDVKMAVDSLVYGDLAVRDASGTMHMSGLTNRIGEIGGKFLDGSLFGRGEVVLPARPDGRPSYAFTLRLEKAEFARLAGLRKAAPGEQYRGRLDASLEIEGLAGEGQGKTVRGRGSATIRDGQVFSLPIFGGLSATLAKVIPGLDFVVHQSDAKVDFLLRDGKVLVERIEINGDVLSLVGRGEYSFDGRLDFLIRVKLMKEHTLVGGLLRRLTSPISGLFEFRLVGTADKPDWRLVNFSKDLLEKLGIREKEQEPKAE